MSPISYGSSEPIIGFWVHNDNISYEPSLLATCFSCLDRKIDWGARTPVPDEILELFAVGATPMEVERVMQGCKVGA